MATTTIAYLNSVITYFEAREADPWPLLAEMGVAPSMLARPQERVDFEVYNRLFEFGEQALADPLFGFHVGCDIEAGDYGVLGYLVMNCNSLEQAIDYLLKYQDLVADIGRSELVCDDMVAEVRWHPALAMSRHVVERNMASWLAFCRRLFGNGASPCEVHFSHARDSATPEEQAFYECPIRFDQPCNRLLFPTQFLSLSIEQSDPAICLLLEQYAEDLLVANDKPFAAQVQACLSQQPKLRGLNLASVATELGLGERTLQRRLKGDDCHFNQLLEMEKQRRAGELLRQQGLSLSELAHELGFAEQSSFNKAFKRWYGMTPLQYQKQHGGERPADISPG